MRCVYLGNPLILTACLLGGCNASTGGEQTTAVTPPAGSPTPPGDATPKPSEPLACSTLPAGSKLFPDDRCCDHGVSKQLVAATWAVHESGPNPDSDTGYYDEMRVRFARGDSPGALTLTIDSRKGGLAAGETDVPDGWLTDAKAADKHWSQADVKTETINCHSCGELLECNGKLTTARVYGGWLRFNDPVALPDGTLYAVHDEREVLITLPADALTTAAGEAIYKVHRVGGGGTSNETGKFDSEDTEVHRWTTNAGRFIRQGDPSRPGRKLNVDVPGVGLLWLEHDKKLGWVTTLEGGYEFPLPTLLRDLSDYHVALNE